MADIGDDDLDVTHLYGELKVGSNLRVKLDTLQIEQKMMYWIISIAAD